MDQNNHNYAHFGRNLKMEEFYDKKNKEFINNKIHSNHKNHRQMSYFVLLFIFSVTTYFVTYISKTNQDLRSMASTIEKRVTFFLYPTDIKTPKGNTFTISPKMVILSDKSISSTIIAIKFDNTMLKVNQIQPYDENATNMKILKSTAFDEANSKGVIKILVGAINTDKPPFKVVSLPQITFQKLSEGSTVLSVDKNESQATFLNQEEAETETGGSIVIF
jgi:hypothetical protein